MFVFPVYSIVFWWFSSKGWDISWHFHMQQHNQTKFSDIHFLHGTVATTSTTTTITPQPPLSPTTVTTTAITTTTEVSHEASFSHRPFSDFEGSFARKFRFHIFHFQFQQLIRENIWALPCLALACCSFWTSNMCQEKQFFSKQWASVWPISFRFRSGYRLGQLVGSKKLQNNDSGKPFFWKFLMLSWTKLEAFQKE